MAAVSARMPACPTQALMAARAATCEAGDGGGDGSGARELAEEVAEVEALWQRQLAQSVGLPALRIQQALGALHACGYAHPRPYAHTPIRPWGTAAMGYSSEATMHARMLFMPFVGDAQTHA